MKGGSSAWESFFAPRNESGASYLQICVSQVGQEEKPVFLIPDEVAAPSRYLAACLLLTLLRKRVCRRRGTPAPVFPLGSPQTLFRKPFPPDGGRPLGLKVYRRVRSLAPSLRVPVALFSVREPLGSEVCAMQFNYAVMSGEEERRLCPRCGSRRVFGDGDLPSGVLVRLRRCSWCGFFWGEPEADA